MINLKIIRQMVNVATAYVHMEKYLLLDSNFFFLPEFWLELEEGFWVCSGKVIVCISPPVKCRASHRDGLVWPSKDTVFIICVMVT